MSSAGTGAQGARLQKNVLSVWNCIALSAALMGPVLAVVLNAPAAGPSTGEAMPLAFLIALIAIIFVGNTVVLLHNRRARGVLLPARAVIAKAGAFGSVVADEPITHADGGGLFDDRSAHPPLK